jgi:hypothetical protein
MAHEAPIIIDIMIRRKNRDRIELHLVSEAHQTVKHRRRGSAVGRLHHQFAGLAAGGHPRVKLTMAAHHYGRRALGAYAKRDPPDGSLEHRLIVLEERAVLLGHRCSCQCRR